MFSFKENHDEVLGFIYGFQWHVSGPTNWNSKRLFAADLKNVAALGLDAALVLTAEYNRSCLKNPTFRPSIDDSEWAPETCCLLDGLGFYRFVDAKWRSGGGFDDVETPLRFVPFISGKQVVGEQVNDLIERLKTAAGTTPKRIATYGALVEAMKNVHNHAYPLNAPPQVMPMYRMWWAAGAYDPEDRTLQFAMYDQGVGIPATLPKQGFFEAIRKRCPPEFNDADVIAGGIEYGRTSTELHERGNGLWTICKLVEELEGSSVRILSGRGEVTYSSHGDVKKKLHGKAFCGTLVEWSLILPLETQSVGNPS